MSSAAPEPPVVAARTPSWGLGDVWIGIAASFFGAGISASIVLAAAGETSFDDLSLALVAVSQVGLWVGLLGVPLLATHYKGNGIVRDLHLRVRWSDLWIGGLVGALAQVAIPLLYLPFLELFDTARSDLEAPARELTDRATDPFGVVMLILITVIGAPIFEEIFYRGLMQRSLLKRQMPPWVAIAGSAVVFAAFHFQPLQFPALCIFGALAGYLAYRYDRLGPAIAAHVAFNTVAVVLLLLAE